MKLKDEGKIVEDMDELVPKKGEVIGGSAREDRLDILDQRIKDMNIDTEA
jgi:asparaginyl-tRNA synthetase